LTHLFPDERFDHSDRHRVIELGRTLCQRFEHVVVMLLTALFAVIIEMLRQSPARYGGVVSRTPFGKRW
jgi:hypothetical protein